MIGVFGRLLLVLIPSYIAAYLTGSMIYTMPMVAATVLAISYYDKLYKKLLDDEGKKDETTD